MGQNDDMTIRAPDPGDPDRSKKEPSQEPASSGFQEAPKFETPPVYSQPPNPPETPSYERVAEPPRPPETPSYGQVVEPPKKKNNKTLWIILIVVILVICCCCILAVVWGNNLMKEFNINDFEDLLNEFSQLIKIAPAYI
jgi:hypothetical protein